LFSLRVFCLGISRTGGLEDQRHYPEVCRLVALGLPFRWGARGLGGGGVGSWERAGPPGPVFCLAPPLGAPLPYPPKAHRIRTTINADRNRQTFVLSSVWGKSGRLVVAPSGCRTCELYSLGSHSVADSTCSSRSRDKILMFDAQWCCTPEGVSTNNCAASRPFATCTARLG
jgi:hypothetical protein